MVKFAHVVTFKGPQTDLRKQAKAAAVKKVLDSLIHNGNYKYTRVLFPAVEVHVEENSELSDP